MTTLGRYLAWLLITAAAVLASRAIVGWAKGAPAPLARAERHKEAPRVPARCVMDWAGVSYEAEFWPGGRYRAWREGGGEWAGTWQVSEGRVLTITERYGGADFSITYVIALDGRLRAGRFSSGCAFALQPR